MRFRVAKLVQLAVGCGVFHHASPLGAQQRLETLTVSLPTTTLSAADVELSHGNRREVIGQVLAARPLQLDMNAVNIGKGQRVDLTLQGGKVVLIPAGVTDSECQAANRDPLIADCRRVEVLTWGTSASYGLTAIDGVLSLIDRPLGPRFSLGAEYSGYNFNRLDAVACDLEAIPALTGCEATSSGSGLGIYGEFALDRHFGLGARIARTSYQVEQHYGATPVNHDVTLTMFDLYSSWRPMTRGPFEPFAQIGMSYWDNADEFGNDEFDPRGEAGLRLFGSIGADLRLRNPISLRGSVGYGSGGSRDADSHFRYSFGGHFNF